MKTLKRFLRHGNTIDIVREDGKYRFFLNEKEVNLYTLVYRLNLPFTGRITVENVINVLKNKRIKSILNTPVIFHGGY